MYYRGGIWCIRNALLLIITLPQVVNFSLGISPTKCFLQQVVMEAAVMEAAATTTGAKPE